MTRRKKTLFIMIASFLFVGLVSSTYMLSYASYSKQDSLKLIYSGNIVGTHADFTIQNIFVEDVEVNNMASVPANYVINSAHSYCYTDDPTIHDGNVTLYTNANNEHIFAGFSKSEKCVLHFKEVIQNYWYDVSETIYTHPSYGGTLQSSGTATGSDYYIGVGVNKYYACAYYSSYGKEVCLSQPYTQYGLEGHTVGTNFTADEIDSARAALMQVYQEAGITGVTMEECASINTTTGNGVRCYSGGLMCLVSSAGNVTCQPSSSVACSVYVDGTARCRNY